jgi:hypothetical protein
VSLCCGLLSLCSHSLQLIFELQPQEGCSLPPLPRPFVATTLKATVRNIRQLIARHINSLSSTAATAARPPLDSSDLLILCRDELLGPDHSLDFILRTRWHEQEKHLVLTYNTSV